MSTHLSGVVFVPQTRPVVVVFHPTWFTQDNIAVRVFAFSIPVIRRHCRTWFYFVCRQMTFFWNVIRIDFATFTFHIRVFPVDGWERMRDWIWALRAASHPTRKSSETRVNFWKRVALACSNANFLHLEAQINLNLNLGGSGIVGIAVSSFIVEHYTFSWEFVNKKVFCLPPWYICDRVFLWGESKMIDYCCWRRCETT